MRYCVFAGSNTGREEYVRAAVELGRTLASNGIGVVFGGASVGLMGVMADAVRAQDGEIIGVIPKSLVNKEVAHAGLADLRIVDTMHQRKALMSELSDGFIALPGGIGTLEELFEVWTWGQLGHHKNPCAILNIRGYFDQLSSFLEHVVQEGFLKPIHRNMLIVESDIDELLLALGRYQAPNASKWNAKASVPLALS
jgi:uncharacterized protein (TIGR00730 family)